MTDPRLLNGDELVAVASVWRAAGREVVTSFLGTSMLPTIAPGVEVTIDCGKRWEIGDIIAYVSGEHLVVHRVEAATADRKRLLTRGDHRAIPDEPLDEPDAVIGVITRIRSGVQWIVSPPAPQSWFRARMLSATMGAFHTDVERCRRRIRMFRMARKAIGAGWSVFRRR